MTRLASLFPIVTVLVACGGGGTPSAAQPAAASAVAAQAKAPTPASPPAAAADEPVIDVCAVFPRAVIEKAFGKVARTKNLNRTDPNAPMRTAGGSGGCYFEGPKLGLDARLEVHTATGLARQGLGGPRRFIDTGWAVGPDASAVDGLGEVARMRPSQGKSVELIAGNADRVVHLLAQGISREQAIAIVRAGLEMKLR